MKKHKGKGSKFDAAEVLDEARPLLLRALIKCGHIATHPPRDPQASTAERVLNLLREEPDPDYEYFRQLGRDTSTWRELRQKVDVVACKIAGLAARHRLDPCTALRAAFLMRIGVDHPLKPLDVAAIVDLAGMVSRLGEVATKPDQSVTTANARAVFSGSPSLDPLDLAIVKVAMEEGGWIKTALLRDRVKPWKFGVGARGTKEQSAFRKRVVRLCKSGFLERNKPQGKMVRWTGKQP